MTKAKKLIKNVIKTLILGTARWPINDPDGIDKRGKFKLGLKFPNMIKYNALPPNNAKNVKADLQIPFKNVFPIKIINKSTIAKITLYDEGT